ncbi:monocarboxylate transporter 12-like isoform X2 [Lytechinus pictus]
MANSSKQDEGGTPCRPSRGFKRWFILAGLFMVSFLELGSTRVLSLLLDDFTFQFDVSTSYIGAIYGLVSGMPYFLGLITVPLLRYFSVRLLTIGGGILATGGLIAASFTTTAPQLTAALIAFGFGFVFIVLPTNSSPTDYFPDYFEIATGVLISGGSVGVMVMPWLFDIIIDNYGWRGGLLLLGALNSHYILIGSLLKPTKRRSKRKDSCSNQDGEHVEGQMHATCEADAIDLQTRVDDHQGQPFSPSPYTDHSQHAAGIASLDHGDDRKLTLYSNISQELNIDVHLIEDGADVHGYVNLNYEGDPPGKELNSKTHYQGQCLETEMQSAVKEERPKTMQISNLDTDEMESSIVHHSNKQSTRSNLNRKTGSSANFEEVEMNRTDTETNDKNERKVTDSSCSCSVVSSIARFYKEHPLMIVICIQVYLFACTYVAWLLFTIPNAQAKGLSDLRAAQLSIAGGVANFIGRFSCGFITSKEVASIEVWYMIASALSATAFFVNYVADSFWFLTALSVMFGFSIGFKAPAQFTLVMNAVGKEHFKIGLGILFLVGGSVYPFVGLISGAIYDRTQSYDVTFCIMGALDVIAGILMIAPITWNRFCRKHPPDFSE